MPQTPSDINGLTNYINTEISQQVAIEQFDPGKDVTVVGHVCSDISAYAASKSCMCGFGRGGGTRRDEEGQFS